MINQCHLYRYIISYEPYNFKGRLDDFPQTTAMRRQMDRAAYRACANTSGMASSATRR
jgi:hypothetical protein